MTLEKSAISDKDSKVSISMFKHQVQDEKWLVEAAKGGHANAFGTLCERYAERLLRVAQRITRSREDAEDAVQDSFLSALVHLTEFDGRSSFATWLTRIAINSALMILRKKRSVREIARDGVAYEIADGAPNPERCYAQYEQARILEKAIHALRPPLREVVRMQRLQEFSLEETANAMGISLPATKGRLFHAKAALRKSAILRVMHQRRAGREFRVLSAA